MVMGLKAKLTFRLLTGVLVFGAVLFIPAGSFKFGRAGPIS